MTTEKTLICLDCGHDVGYDSVGMTETREDITELKHFNRETGDFTDNCEFPLEDGECGCGIARVGTVKSEINVRIE